MTTCKLSELVSPAFVDAHRAIKSGTATEIVAKGGRGSTKSSWVSLEMVLQLIKHPEVHAVVMRKVANTLRTTVYAQYVWAITELGLYDKFRCTVSPMEITYRRTGQKIMFFGADDPGKIKSIKVPFGYIGLLHLEELDQFSGPEEVRNIEQSILRGGDIALEFKSFNPPRTAANWANRYVQIPKPGQLIHHSTYLTTPPEWLGQRFIDDAEYLKGIDPKAYEHEYLGVPNATGGQVFDNLEIREIPAEEIGTFGACYYGQDWGWYPDPNAFNACAYNPARRELHIFEEHRANKTSNQAWAEVIAAHKDDLITADSAEKKSIGDFKAYGFNMRAAEKGPGSVEYSMKWLASLSKIVIDPARCPATTKEFAEYEYEKDKDGNVVTGYPDANNHHIDAVRYATERIWRRRGK